MTLAKLFRANRTPRHLRALTRPAPHAMMTARYWLSKSEGWVAEHFEKVSGDVAAFIQNVGGFRNEQAAQDFIRSADARQPRKVRFSGRAPAADLVVAF